MSYYIESGWPENEQYKSQGDDSLIPYTAERSFKVSLVIPTLNEADNLPLILPYIPFDWVDEVLLVDGQSKDNTVERAKELLPEIKVVLEEKPGKGAALQAGYRAATGDIIIVMDADGSNDPREIPRFIEALLQGADFAKGSRFASMGGTTDMPRLRKWGNAMFVHIVNMLFSVNFTDLCYGYHAFWRDAVDPIDLTGFNGFEIDTALYLRAVRHRLRIVDVPSFEGFRFYGDGKLQTFPDGWRVLRTIFHEWLLSLRSNPAEIVRGFRGLRPGSSSLENRKRFANWTDQALVPQPDITRTILQLLHYSIQGAPEDPTYELILPQLLILAIKSLRATSGSIVLLDKEGVLIDSYAVYRGQVHSLNDQQVNDTIERGLTRWILENQRPTVVENTLKDPRWLASSWEVEKGSSRSVLGIPLVDEDQVFGVLTLARDTGPFTEDDLAILNADQDPSPNGNQMDQDTGWHQGEEVTRGGN